jgi:predicted ferric reductase
VIARGAALVLCAAVAVMVWLTLSSTHLDAGPASLVVSAVTAAVATVLIAFQPVLALLARSRPVAWRGHWMLGLTAFVLVLAHVVALWVLSPDDVLFAVSPDGPTRARMAVLATASLVIVVVLGTVRRWSTVAPEAVQILHAFFASLALLLGVGHAVLTDGALDGPGTVALLLLAALGVAGVVAARLSHLRSPPQHGRSEAAKSDRA